MQPPLPAAGAGRPGAPSTAPGASASAPPGPSSANPDGDADIPRPEHPRPDLRRDEWVNLNGVWRFSFDPQNRGEQQRWYRIPHPDVAARTGEVGSPVEDPFLGHIVVPFPWESRLSGVADPTYKGAAWYQRALEVPPEWMDAGPAPAPTPDAGADSASAPPPGAAPRRPPAAWLRRPTLCFGAVDWSAKVWVDGRFVTEHDGGYTPFYVDLTPYLRPGPPGHPDRARLGRLRRRHPAGEAGGRVVHPLRGDLAAGLAGGAPRGHIAQAHVTPHLETGRASFAVAVDATGESAAGAYRRGGDFGGRGLPSGRDRGGGHAGADDRAPGGAGAASRGPGRRRARTSTTAWSPSPPNPLSRVSLTPQPPPRERGSLFLCLRRAGGQPPAPPGSVPGGGGRSPPHRSGK